MLKCEVIIKKSVPVLTAGPRVFKRTESFPLHESFQRKSPLEHWLSPVSCVSPWTVPSDPSFGLITQLLFFINHLTMRPRLSEAESFGIQHATPFRVKGRWLVCLWSRTENWPLPSKGQRAGQGSPARHTGQPALRRGLAGAQVAAATPSPALGLEKHELFIGNMPGSASPGTLSCWMPATWGRPYFPSSPSSDSSRP